MNTEKEIVDWLRRREQGYRDRASYSVGSNSVKDIACADELANAIRGILMGRPAITAGRKEKR